MFICDVINTNSVMFNNEFYNKFHTMIKIENSYKGYKIKLIYLKYSSFYLSFQCSKYEMNAYMYGELWKWMEKD